MKRLALLAGMIVVLVSLPLKAQVTIGSTEPPQSYSLLELVSQNRGLRLPQITFGEGAGEVNRDSFTEMLTNAGNNAKGLQIFNMNTRCVETWNGDVWLSACGEDLLCNNIPLPEFAHYNVHYNDAGGTPASPTFNSPKAMMEALAAENPDFSTIYGDYYEWDSNWSNNKTINEDTDCGVLYEMLRYQNPTPCSICPDGYRLPTQDEWERIAPYDCNASFAVGNTNISNQTTGTAPQRNPYVIWVAVNCANGVCVAQGGDNWFDFDNNNLRNGYAVYHKNEWLAFDNKAGNLLDGSAPEPLLFLPAAGYQAGDELRREGIYGLYWSSTLSENDEKPYHLQFDGRGFSTAADNLGADNSIKMSIRCVKKQ